MIKVTVNLHNITTNKATFSTLTEANLWISSCNFPEDSQITIIDITAEVLQQEKNKEARDFLNSTDYKVLRHLREKTLGTVTSLTEDEFIALEMARQQAAEEIV